jgi:hypothetical protein
LNNALSVDVKPENRSYHNRFADEGAIRTAIGFDPTQPVTVNSNRFGGYFEYLETIGVGVVPKDLARVTRYPCFSCATTTAKFTVPSVILCLITRYLF